MATERGCTTMRVSALLFGLWVLLLFLPMSALVADPAPSFQIPTNDGVIELKDLKGEVVYLDFWASWCGPCRKSMPWLNRMQEKYDDAGFRVIGVNLDKERELADEFLQTVPVNFQLVYDPEGKLASQYQLLGMPNSFMIGRDGMIQQRHVGFMESKLAEYEEQILQLLKQ